MADVPKLTDLFADTMREAEAGDPAAWRKLGDAFLYGMGVEYDSEKALACYRKGADAGDMFACYAIFELNSNGVSLVGDSEAKEMCIKAAKLGHGKAEMFCESYKWSLE